MRSNGLTLEIVKQVEHTVKFLVDEDATCLKLIERLTNEHKAPFKQVD